MSTVAHSSPVGGSHRRTSTPQAQRFRREEESLRGLSSNYLDTHRLGYGVYVRAEISPITKQPMLAGDGFNAVARRALDKLKVRWEPPTAEVDYNEGRTTQMPMNPMVRLRGDRFSRKLRYKTMELAFER